MILIELLFTDFRKTKFSLILERLSEIINIRCLTPCLLVGKYSVNVSW